MVCISVRDTLIANEISAAIAKSADVEDIWVTGQSNVLPLFTVGTACRPPYGPLKF